MECPRRDDLLRKFCVLLDPFADAEERGEDAVFRQACEHPRRDRRIGTVVDGQRDFAARRAQRRQADPIRTEQLTSGPETCGSQHHVIRDHRAERPGPYRRVNQRRGRSAYMNGGGGRQNRRRHQTRPSRNALRSDLHSSQPNFFAKKFSQSVVQVRQSWAPGITFTALGGKTCARSRCASANRSSCPYPKYNSRERTSSDCK